MVEMRYPILFFLSLGNYHSMKIKVIVVGGSSAKFDLFLDQAFQMVQEVSHINNDGIAIAPSWVGTEIGNDNTITVSNETIIFSRVENTASGVRLVAVGSINQVMPYQSVKDAYIEYLNGRVDDGSTGGNGSGGGTIITSDDGTGDGNTGPPKTGLISLPGVAFYLIAAYSAYKYQENKNPIYLATGAFSAINIINK